MGVGSGLGYIVGSAVGFGVVGTMVVRLMAQLLIAIVLVSLGANVLLSFQHEAASSHFPTLAPEPPGRHAAAKDAAIAAASTAETNAKIEVVVHDPELEALKDRIRQSTKAHRRREKNPERCRQDPDQCRGRAAAPVAQRLGGKPAPAKERVTVAFSPIGSSDATELSRSQCPPFEERTNVVCVSLYVRRPRPRVKTPHMLTIHQPPITNHPSSSAPWTTTVASSRAPPSGQRTPPSRPRPPRRYSNERRVLRWHAAAWRV